MGSIRESSSYLISFQLVIDWQAWIGWRLALLFANPDGSQPVMAKETESLMAIPESDRDDFALIGESPAMVALRMEMDLAARSQAKVLISGETGAGKEVVARLIHHNGQRRSRRFVALNCSGIPETLLESELFGHTRGSFTGAYRDKPGLVRLADNGTLFLDELGEMSLRMQAVLLRFAETGEVQPVGADGPTGRTDVRLITATHRDLRAQIDSGAFREDLYYRLNVIQIRVPPLRERGETDVRQLLHFFLHRASALHALPVPQLTADTERMLIAYRWPGNVRELKNITERLVVGNAIGPVTPDALPPDVRGGDAPAGVSRTKAAAQGTPASTTVAAPPTTVAEGLWDRMLNGESFWTVVHQPFKSHDLTRADVRALIFRGLQYTRGNYRQLVKLFHMPDSDYKRFLSFLSQHDCNLPFQAHRAGDAQAPGDRIQVAC
jgi:DNA-binding NtrC family response regulator